MSESYVFQHFVTLFSVNISFHAVYFLLPDICQLQWYGHTKESIQRKRSERDGERRQMFSHWARYPANRRLPK